MPRHFPFTFRNIFLRNLADIFLEGAWSQRALLSRAKKYLQGGGSFLSGVIRRLLTTFPEKDQARRGSALVDFLRTDQGLSRGWEALFQEAGSDPEELLRRLLPNTVVSIPDMLTAPWPVPSLPTGGALAEWLSLTPGEMAWLADLHGHEATRSEGPLRHYSYLWKRKRGGRARLLEIPRPRLKAIQRRVAGEILSVIPAHEAAHGYCTGRSILTNALPHIGKEFVLRLDLRDFFPSVPASRVHALFAAIGYPRDVARLLTGLCTNVVPAEELLRDPSRDPFHADPGVRHLYRWPHLPQGAPSSPALANLCARHLDERLSALAQHLGAAYTRYADDLTFSGGKDLQRQARRVHVLVCRVALEEGFEVNTRKTQFLTRSMRQSVAGVVVNARPNVDRRDYDRLKATLRNCLRIGPLSQNRSGIEDYQGHLLGRVAHVAVLHPEKGARLLDVWKQIRWE